MVTFWATFRFKQIYYNFTLIGTLRFQKWVDVDILDIQFGLCYRYFDIFGPGDFWANFCKIG